MKQTVLISMCLLALAITAAPATAQSSEGDQEISFLASFFHNTDSDSDGFLTASARYGRFLSDALLVGGGLTAGGEIDSIDESLSLELFTIYHFTPEETQTWYARAGLFTTVDEIGDAFVEGAIGYKSYFSENTAFFWEGILGTAIGSGVEGEIVRSVAGLTFVF